MSPDAPFNVAERHGDEKVSDSEDAIDGGNCAKGRAEPPALTIGGKARDSLPRSMIGGAARQPASRRIPDAARRARIGLPGRKRADRLGVVGDVCAGKLAQPISASIL